jgi:L-aminopeptidase/D-esterase-like protein/N-acetylglutamate synthase-like GNAT family acetyltransferase
MASERDDLTDVPGFRVGSAEDPDACTGCTVVLCPPDGAVGGVHQMGGAPGTRETDPLRPLHLVDRCHAVLLAGGSAFGLDAAGGVVRYLERKGIGFETRAARVPIVPAAVIYDLGLGRADVRPDAAMGEAACIQADAGGPVRQGNAGAGCGASVGKIHGMEGAMKGGLGSASAEAIPGVFVGALVAVNAFGDVTDREGGRILAGARIPGSRPDAPAFADTVTVLRSRGARPLAFGPPATNTVLAVVATNARLDKEGANVLAQMAGSGLARAVRPVHTQVDGDTVFALAAGERECDVSLLGAVAADLVALATMRGVLTARPLGGLPCVDDMRGRCAGLHVRPGSASDAEAAVAIARNLGEWLIGSAMPAIGEEMGRYASLIAEIDGHPVGFLIHAPSETHPEPGLIEIRWFAVERTRRGQGVGHALLRALEDDARARGVTMVELWTVAETEFYPPYADTRAFYRACGYEEFYTDDMARERKGGTALFFRKKLAGV